MEWFFPKQVYKNWIKPQRKVQVIIPEIMQKKGNPTSNFWRYIKLFRPAMSFIFDASSNFICITMKVWPSVIPSCLHSWLAGVTKRLLLTQYYICQTQILIWHKALQTDFSVQTTPGNQLGLGTQPPYEAPSDLRFKSVET